MPPKLPLRIAILECDTPSPNTRAQYGSYAGVFTSLLHSAADTLSHPLLSSSSDLELTSYDVVTAQAYPPLSSIDAILITGSRLTSFDPDPWITKLVDFTRSVLAQSRVRVVGICFGHQIVARALDAPVGRSTVGWEVSVTPMTLTARGREIFATERNTLDIHQMHRDVVHEYPAGVESLAHTDKCPTQGMYIPRRLVTVQGHPEFTAPIVQELLDIRGEAGIFDRETWEDGVRRVKREQDGVLIARGFLRFLLEE